MSESKEPRLVRLKNWKVLLDGERISELARDMFDVVDDGVILHLIFGADILKRFDPKRFTAIYFDDQQTTVIDMKIESYYQLPYSPTKLVIDVMLKGKPQTNYSD